MNHNFPCIPEGGKISQLNPIIDYYKSILGGIYRDLKKALLIYIKSNLTLPTAIHNKLWSMKQSNHIATESQLHRQYRITNEKEGASKVTVHIGGSIRHYTQWFIPSSYLSSPTQ